MSTNISSPKHLKRSHSPESPLSSQDENATPQTTPKPASTFGSKLDQFKYETSPSSTTTTSSLARRSPRLRQSPVIPTILTTPSPSPLKRLRPNTPTKTTSPTSFMPTKSLTSPRSTNHPKSYAPPSRYAHLSPLNDTIVPDLLLVFIGVNPGIQTAVQGHAYAHPSNRFWHLLHVSGLTPERRLHPSEDRQLPWTHGYGHTNIVSRPTKDQAELSKDEMVAGAKVLEEKCRSSKPEAVVIVGKGIWEAIWRWKYGRPIKKEEFNYGWQTDDEKMGRCDGWKGAKVFVATSTSGQAAGMRPEEKERIWKPLGEWVAKRRQEGYMPPNKVEVLGSETQGLMVTKKEEDVKIRDIKQEVNDVLEGE